MSRVEPQQLLDLQNHVEKIRNFCILAHVDHGKTTLSDSLVSSNGIISARLAGKLRFLDSTEEEQKRGITMHSSAIALLYRLEDKSGGGGDDTTGPAAADEYLINLVDSPGHIDFSSDVSTAARLCDGALVVVDVLEGVCTQTHAVIYKALRERMRPCIVLNKIDRLIVELKLTPMEAFSHLRRIIENVNALANTLVRSELLKELEETKQATTSLDLDDDDHPLIVEWTFSPEKGNVQFASALDGWGFGLMKFINYYHKTLGLNKNILKKYLFDDYSINLTTKKIIKIDHSFTSNNNNSSSSADQRVPMFVTLVLEPLWEFYSLMLIESSLQPGLAFMKEKFNIVLPNKEINTRDLRLTLQSCMRRWLPLADSILRMVVKTMPNPREAQKSRASTLLLTRSLEINSTLTSDSAEATEVTQKLQKEFQFITESIETCASDEAAPLVVFISKMMSIRVADLTKEDVQLLNLQRQQKSGTDYIPLKPDDEVFMALGRIFSGRLSRQHRQSSMFVLGHKHDPAQIIQEVVTSSSSSVESNELAQLNQSSSKDFVPTAAKKTVATVTSTSSEGVIGPPQIGCYMLLGPSAYPAETVPAGNIVGIIGLDDYILKTATITDHWCTYPLKSMTFQSKPMLKVAVEPISHKDLRAVEKGLSLLFQYDPAVEIGMEDNGQHTMTCLGELHLDQCVKALTERFAKCEVKVSEPLISFRETILPLSMVEGEEGNSSGTSSSNIAAGNPSSSLSGMAQLPPPWSDIPGLSKAKQGTIRLTLDSQNLAITIQCFPLALNAANYLEKEMTLMNQYDDHLLQYYSQLSRHLQLSSSSPSTSKSKDEFFTEYLERNKEFQTVWEKVMIYLLGKEDEGKEAVLSNNSTEELYQEIALLSPEVRQQYLDALFAALQYSSDTPADPKALATSLLASVLSIGPKACPTNLLFFSSNCALTITNQILSDHATSSSSSTVATTLHRNKEEHHYFFHKIWNRLHHSIIVGFQEAVGSGYLMAEPIFGVGYVIQKIEVFSGLLTQQILNTDEVAQFTTHFLSSPLSPSSLLTPPPPPSADEVNVSNVAALERAQTLSTGHLISEMKDHLRLVLLSCPLRTVEPIYQCNLQCDQSQIGNLYAVLSRRRGNVYKEDIIEGTSMFLLSAYLPVAQSFQFTSELLKKTSGSGTAPQLSFSHWKLLLQDPFWKPRTEDEKEEFGDMAFNDHNLAKLYINQIRKRKGLPIDEQIVVFAEKQRTLNKKK